MKRILLFCLLATVACSLLFFLTRGIADERMSLPVQAPSGGHLASGSSEIMQMRPGSVPQGGAITETSDPGGLGAPEQIVDVKESFSMTSLKGKVIISEEDKSFPVAGADIQLWPGTQQLEGAPDFEFRTRSGFDGSFQFTDVPMRALMTLRAEATGLARWSSGIIVYPEGNWVSWRGRHVLYAKPSESAEIRISMEREGTAQGVVYNPFGNRIPLAEVFAVEDAANECCWFPSPYIPSLIDEIRKEGERAEAFRAVADANGVFIIRGMPTAFASYLFCAFDSQGHYATVESVQFTKGQKTLIQDLRIPSISSLRIRVLSPEGKPLHGVNVQADCRHKNALENDSDRFELSLSDCPNRETDASGIADFRSLDAGKYLVKFWPDKFCPESRQVEIRENEPTELAITARQGGTIAGFVSGPDGSPANFASIHIRTGELTFIDGSFATFESEITIRDDGTFRKDGIPDKRICVTARALNLCEESIYVSGEARNLAFDLKPYPEFQGTLDLPPKHRNISRIVCSFDSCWRQGWEVPVDESGNFRVNWGGWREDAEVFLTLAFTGWPPVILGPFKPRPGDAIDLGRIRKPGERIVKGLISDPSGNPVEGSAVSFMTDAVRAFEIETRTAKDGSFALTGVPLLRGGLLVQSEGFPPLEYRLNKDETGPVAIAFKRAAFIKGRVIDANGETAPCIELSVLQFIGNGWDELAQFRSMQTDANGNFTSYPLNPGRYLVRLRYNTPGQGPGSERELDLDEGDSAQVELVAPFLEKK